MLDAIVHPAVLLVLAAPVLVSAHPGAQEAGAGVPSLGEAQRRSAWFLAQASAPDNRELAWALVDATTAEPVASAWANVGEFLPIEGTDEWAVIASPASQAILLDRASANGLLRDPVAIQRVFAPARSFADPAIRRTAPRHLFHQDARRFLTIEAGDVHRGEVDWTSGEAAQRRVTELGVFQGKPTIAWSGRHVFLWGAFDAAKPVVRIDLESGAVDEVDWLNFTPAGEGPQRAPTFTTNPSVTVAMAGVGDWVQLVELASGRTLRVPPEMAPEEGGHAAPLPAGFRVDLFGHGDSLQWVDDRRALVFGGIDYSRLDLEAATLTVRTWKARLGDSIDEHRIVVTRVADSNTCVVSAPERGGKPRHFAFDLETEALSELPEEVSAALAQGGRNVRWIDGQHVVYPRTEGGLSNVGLWIHDRGTGESRRVATFQDFTELVHLPEAGRLVVNRLTSGTSGSSHQTHVVDLEAGGETLVREGWRSIQPLPRARIPLGFGGDEGEPEGAAASPVLPARPGSDAPAKGLAAVLDTLAGESQSVRVFAVGCFEALRKVHGLTAYYDLEQAIGAMVDTAREQYEAEVAEAKARQEAGYELPPNANHRLVSRMEAQKRADEELLASGFQTQRTDAVMLRTDFSVAIDEDAARRTVREAALGGLSGYGEELSEETRQSIADQVAEQVLEEMRRSKQLVHSSRLNSNVMSKTHAAVREAQRQQRGSTTKR